MIREMSAGQAKKFSDAMSQRLCEGGTMQDAFEAAAIETGICMLFCDRVDADMLSIGVADTEQAHEADWNGAEEVVQKTEPKVQGRADILAREEQCRNNRGPF